MKKTKILTVLGVLLAMGITACGGNKASSSKSEEKSSQSQSQPASSVAPAPASSSSQPASTPDTSAPEQGSSSSSSAVAHVHVWNLPNKDELEEEYAEVDQEPTCTAAGQKTWYCECGETKTEAIKKLGHEFGEWAVTPGKEATCTVDGEESRHCTRAGCDAVETRVIKAEHKYGDPVTVEASGDGKEYTKEVCSVDQTIRIKVNQSQVTYASGSSRKSATPEGYTKLNGDGQSMSVKFNYTHFAVGQLYLFGRMDGWSTSGNQSAGFYRNGTPSIEVKVNGSVVDISAQKEKSYLDYFGDHDNPTELDSPSDHLSDEGYAPVGSIVLVDGVNELIYKRVQTQNMIIKDFVFVIQDSEHVHEAAATYSSNETQHWHACTVPGCPAGGKADVPADHTFEDKTDDARNKAATCSAEGAKVEKCSVCGYEKVTPIAKIAHTYPNDGAYTQTKAPTCTEAGEKERQCSVCNAKDVQPVPALGHTFGESVENYAAVTEGDNKHIAASAHNCSVCEKSALRWSALDFDETLSSGTSKVKVNNSADYNAVKTGNAENDGGQNNASPAVSVGNHYVYKVNVGAAVEKAGLSFRIFTRTSAYPVFRTIDNDGKRGNYYDESTQTFTGAPARYGVRINGQEVYFDEDLLAAEGNAETSKDLWFDFPLQSFSLVAGVNTIDVYSMGGYSQQGILEFQLTGLAHVTPSHIHNGGDAWLNDETYHWHKCTVEGCPAAEGIYGKVEHDFGDPVVVAATVDAAGSETYTCATCGKVKVVVLPQLALQEWVKEDLTSAMAADHGCTSQTYAEGIVGYKFNKTTAVATFTYTPEAAGTYTLKLLLSPKKGNQASTGFWKQDGAEKTRITVNGVQLEAPENDLDFSVCTVESATAADGNSWSKTAMMEPVWFEIADVTLTAGENTIVVQWIAGSYSYFLCGAAIHKQKYLSITT